MMNAIALSIHPPYGRCSLAPGPLPVSRLRCEGKADGLHVAGTVSAEVDTVSIEVSTASAKYGADLHYVAVAVGNFSTVVPLTGGTAQFRVAARAHRRSCAEDGGNGTWSSLMYLEGTCSSAALVVEAVCQQTHTT